MAGNTLPQHTDPAPWVDTATFVYYSSEFDNSLVASYEALFPPYDESNEIVQQWNRASMAVAEASWILRTLSHGRVHPEESWVEDYKVHSGQRDVVLRRSPVSSIVRVAGANSGSILTASHDEQQVVRLGSTEPTYGVGSVGCGSEPATVRISYVTRDTLPPGTQAKVLWLANQYLLAASNKKCDLPDRISSITRAGVSWTMLDPMDFVEKGMIGSVKIDPWIEASRRAFSPGSIIEPFRSRRVFSVRVAGFDIDGNPN